MNTYLDWAQALTPDQRYWIWASCLVLFLVYVIINNWEVLFNDDDWHDDNQLPPDDPHPPDRMRWG